MKKKIILFAIFVSFGILFYSCSPSAVSDEYEILPADRLINKLELNRRKIRVFEGNGTLNINTPDMKNSANFRVILRKPDSLNVSFFGPFGIELANILIVKNNFMFYETLSNTLYEGNVDNGILRTIFKIDLSINDLLDAFVGSVNLSEKLYREPTTYRVDYNKYLLSYNDSISNRVSRYTVDVRDLGLINYSVVDKNNRVQLEGNYSGFRIIETVAIPYKILLRNPTKNQNMQIEYNSVKVNKSDSFIDFTIPDDINRIKI